jgi:hypothetical protein
MKFIDWDLFVSIAAIALVIISLLISSSIILSNRTKGYYFCVVFFCLLLGVSLDLLYEYYIAKNSDVWGWWPFIVIFFVIIDAISASLINLCFYIFKYYSKRYVWLFSLIFTATILFANDLFHEIKPYWVTSFLIGINLTWCIIYATYKNYFLTVEKYKYSNEKFTSDIGRK